MGFCQLSMEWPQPGPVPHMGVVSMEVAAQVWADVEQGVRAVALSAMQDHHWLSTYWPTAAGAKLAQEMDPSVVAQGTWTAGQSSPWPGASPTVSSEYHALQEACRNLKAQMDVAPAPGTVRLLQQELAQEKSEQSAAQGRAASQARLYGEAQSKLH